MIFRYFYFSYTQNRVGQNRCNITAEGVSYRFVYKALLEFLLNQIYTILTFMQL